MLSRLKKDNRGFTIIEVLIVLAIAGLIMLIVFLAVPALQRNQRNNARNSEASRISSLVTECLSNRNGQNASCMSNDALGLDPSTDLREFSAVDYVNGGSTAPTSSTTVVGVWHARVCKSDGSGVSSTTVGSTGTDTDPAPTSRDFAVIYTLEPNVTRCIDSQ